MRADEPGRWEPEMVEALGAIQTESGVGPVVATEAAFYVLRLEESRPPTMQPLAEARGRIQHELFRSKREAARRRVFDRLKSEIEVELYPEALEKLRATVLAPPAQPD